MGMHFGVIAAEAPLGELLAALSGTRGTFRAGRALGSLEELPEPGPGEDKAIVAGELDGRP